MAYHQQFAELPPAQLVPKNGAAAARSKLATRQTAGELLRPRAEAVKRFEWPKDTAPLPEPRLVRQQRKI